MFPDYEDFFGLYPRWTEDLKKVTGSRWMRSAQDRNSWLSLGETFIQHWTVMSRTNTLFENCNDGRFQFRIYKTLLSLRTILSYSQLNVNKKY